MGLRYQKSKAGHDEVRSRAHDLARPVRSLLLIIDASRDGDEWLRMVQGVVAADLERLLQTGLIEPVASAPAAKQAAPRGPTLDEVLTTFSYSQLYDRLTAQARPRLGLIKGYKMVLDIEKCSNVEEIRVVAVRFVEELRAAEGDKAARDFVRELGAGN